MNTAMQQEISAPTVSAACARANAVTEPAASAAPAIDYTWKFLPDVLTRAHEVDFLDAGERILLSQVQGRTYLNVLALLKYVVSDKMNELKRDRYADNPAVAAVLDRYADNETRYQHLFAKIGRRISDDMPGDYESVISGPELAAAVLPRSEWSVLAFTFHRALLTQAHYKQSVFGDPETSPLFREVLRLHWREASAHAVVDGIEWGRVDAELSPGARDRALGELVALFSALDRVLQLQGAADAEYFASINRREIGPSRCARLQDAFVAAYRWQFIETGLRVPRFANMLAGFISTSQCKRFELSMHRFAGPVHRVH